jgi:hypothetical protein
MLSNRLKALEQLRKALTQVPADVLQRAEATNPWFTQAFIQQALQAICSEYLNADALKTFTASIKNEPVSPATVGVVLAGNIPLVGFHDLLCVYLSGHHGRFKLASADAVLMRYTIEQLQQADPQATQQIQLAERLNGCSAYITTGSNQSAGHFEHYFGQYPHIIRRNRTSVAILDGTETAAELEALADDVYMYFGLGCRNVTHIAVPENYPFEPLLKAFRKYDALKDHNKYRNNYDYQLALYILNGQYYMSNESVLMVENPALYSPVAVIHFTTYHDVNNITATLQQHPDVQALVGHNGIPFGSAQHPTLTQFADGVDTLQFLLQLNQGL